MLHDANDSFPGRLRQNHDVCIFGTGPAGLSLALTLADRGQRVLLIEGGGLEYSARSQAIYAGAVVGNDYYPSDVARLRYFGGTSGHWAGWCRPLDARDFEPRRLVELSGWPIGRADIEPYLERAKQFLGVTEESVSDLLVPDLTGAGLQRIHFEFSRPTIRLGSAYREQVREATNLNCILNASLVDLRLGPDGRGIDHMRVSNWNHDHVEVRADRYVLCLGGLENPRALLNATSQRPEGLANHSGMVGRCFMEHPHFDVGGVYLDRENPVVQKALKQFEALDLENNANANQINSATRVFYSPTEKFLSRHECLNFVLRFEPLVEARKRPNLPLKYRLKRLICNTPTLKDVVSQAVDFECGRDGLIMLASEQAPNPNSAVRLGTEKDEFGNRRLVLDWRLSELDRHTQRVAALEFGKQLAAAGIGRLKIPSWVLDTNLPVPGVGKEEVGGFHHMGTTRMSADPQLGVVDLNLRTHQLHNLYIAGSSVFATSGHANPTLTIVQLSLRLADHMSAAAET